MSNRKNEYHLIAFDPGGTIGWAHLVIDIRAFMAPEAKVLKHLELWEGGELGESETEQLSLASHIMFLNWHHGMNHSTDVVSEDFDLVQTIGGKELLSPVRINAVLDWELQRRCGLKLNLQARQMRTSVTADRLREFGFEGRWVTRGKGKDAFAAMQHAIVWARRVKQKSLSRPWELK